MKITKKQRNLLIALALGDGYISKDGVLEIGHSLKQKEYLDYKYSLIKDFCNHPPKYKISKKYNYTTYVLHTKSLPFLKLLRRILYDSNGKKHITGKILNRLSLQELAIWWMDDGSMSKKINKKTGNIKSLVFTLSTCISKEDNEKIIEFFYSKFSIKFGIRKMKNQYALICGTKEGKKLSKLLYPYLIPSMQYKLFSESYPEME